MEENRTTGKFAQMALHEPKKVGAEDLSSKKAVQTNLKRDSQREARLTIIWILSDAFFKKCGYELPGKTEYTKTEHVALGCHKTEPKADSKAQCVYRNIKRLEDEAQISSQDMRKFMRLSIVANPESMLGRHTEDEFPRTSTVSYMASHLHQTFSAYPNPEIESVIYKIYSWVCGKSIQTALNDEDDRLITGNGIYDSDGKYWREELGVSDIEDDFFD